MTKPVWSGVLMTNGFENDYEGTTGRAIYPTISLISHSCQVRDEHFDRPYLIMYEMPNVNNLHAGPDQADHLRNKRHNGRQMLSLFILADSPFSLR